MGRKKRNDLNQAMHNDLKGFNIKINEFGEIKSSFPVDKLNLFLNHNIHDKKLKDIKSHDEKK
jgi:hypothetical protein